MQFQIMFLLFLGVKRPGDDSQPEGSKKAKPDVSLFLFIQNIALQYIANLPFLTHVCK